MIIGAFKKELNERRDSFEFKTNYIFDDKYGIIFQYSFIGVFSIRKSLSTAANSQHKPISHTQPFCITERDQLYLAEY